jgi:hypothetical protein
MKIAFLTTIFPMEDEFLNDFFNSLENQTFKKFDVIVVNDNYENFKIIKDKYKNLNIIEFKFSNTPAKNREFGINWCKENGYNVLIFGDSDDCFSENRVEKSIQLLEKRNVIVNDLTLFDKKGIIIEKYFSHRIKNNSVIDYEFIKNKNICGLSNTAINLDIVNKKVEFPKAIIAVDWYLFKSLLKNYNALFTNEIVTYYRQYENNTIGLKNDGNFLFWWENTKE